ncbi:ATP-binding protein [Nocardioides sediminis]|uniref:ATP-binding protein n=1 Tax=Nocardioides sediminis TaxID=433648 RepID=UPI000D318A15|nr:AAA family ATPase [Nocardioides sediminis]
MSALPRPDLPPGAHRDLVDALHELHHRAGWPSLRTLARETGVSHTTVSHALSSAKVPGWGTLELLVEALGGDTRAFQDLWLEATTPAGEGVPTAPRIAGRRAELTAVRRHLEQGTGLLLVTGEAGIGKTTLAEAAADAARSLVVSTRCLPLSRQTPLMPFIDLLRTLLGVDGGRPFAAALDACPPYVASSLDALLPELEKPRSDPATDDYARQRVLAAVRAVLDALAGSQRLGLVLDDLHWTDTTTLDLVEQLATRDPRVAIVGTWRQHDAETSEDHTTWWTRVRRQVARQVVEVGPLDRAGTADQLALLGKDASPERVDAVYRRTLGHPLFTAQLAGPDDDTRLPPLLTDLLDARLGDLEGAEWAVTRLLGVADRPLPAELVAPTTGLDDDTVTEALRALDRRHLLELGEHDVSLAHPLIAERVRRRLVPGEAVTVHGRLARRVAAREDVSPAEVAAHFRAADEPEQEFVWRIRAAQEAHERTASKEEADHWLRALEIWPTGSEARATPVRRAAAHLAAVNALDGAGQEPRGLALAVAALGPGLSMDRDDRMELAIRAAGITWGQHGPERALEILDDAEAAYGEGMSPDTRIRCLRLRASLMSKSGHSQAALGVLEEAVSLSDRATDPDVLVRLFATRAWHLGFGGDLAAANRSFDRARAVLREASTPDREAFVAMMHTDVLLHHGRPAAEADAVARSALRQIDELDLRSTITNMVRSNVAEAWLNAGRPSVAGSLLVGDERTADDYSLWPLRWVAARIDIAAGLPDQALELLGRPYQRDLFAELTLALPTGEALLWAGRADLAVELLDELVCRSLPTDTVVIAGPVLVMLARAVADRRDAGSGHDSSSGPDDASRLRALRQDARVDPLGPGPVPVVRPACTAQWEAEVARASGRDTVEHWTRAAMEWDRLERPHESAYCRWRAAQGAQRDGRAALATRLLRHAATDATEHVPLLRAISAATSGDD